MLEFLGALGGIVLVDLALSGDNALVIGAAAAGLPQRQRRLAIVFGGGGAIVLRITFAIVATFLLQFPLLQAIGGLVLLWIAVRLLAGRSGHIHPEAEPATLPDATRREKLQRGFIGAMTTILVADVTMSLDNVLAIGALAAANIPLLVGGLLLSIGLVLVGSAIVATLINKLPWLLDVAALVLGWTAGNMLLHDEQLGPQLEHLPASALLVHAVPILFVLAADLYLRLRARRDTARAVAAAQATTPTPLPRRVPTLTDGGTE
ncbi:MAG: hypothetical protein OJF49_003676 [Ktedonobacterales bacterium]|jgi:YjbE family integral membrane protein|nr:MAG: hypothetical protein OJF49_003676 [Ktedonobacterales bacterium]